jgi:cytochrome P450
MYQLIPHGQYHPPFPSASMPEVVPSLLNLSCIVLLVFLLKRLAQHWSRNGTLPPGPPGYPIIGNVLDWPESKEWKTFHKWAELYGEYLSFDLIANASRDKHYLGDIVHVNLMGQPVILLNSVEVAATLLQQKASLCSHRPHLRFAGDLVGWKDLLTLVDDGPFHKEQRQLFSREIGNKTALERFVPFMEAKTRDFLRAVLDNPSPEALPRHIEL